MNASTGLPPVAARLDGEAEKHTTPCGASSMIWRKWGQGAPVVLVHGGSGSWTHWIRTIPALRQHYEVWACDVPGLGGSAMPSPPLTPASCAAALAGGLRTLIPRARRPRVVAFSFGAHVSTLALGHLGDHVAGFTITGCSALGLRAPLDMPGLPKERPRMTDADRMQVHRKVLEILMFADPSKIDGEAVALQAENVRQARFRSREFALTDEVRRGLAHVKVPLTAIWGGKDAVARPSVEAVLQVVGEHHPELVARVIPGAGHWVMYEAAEAYNEALLEVLRSSPT
jgi:pimeloyl-ACP methyl ester carboxylesterase